MGKKGSSKAPAREGSGIYVTGPFSSDDHSYPFSSDKRRIDVGQPAVSSIAVVNNLQVEAVLKSIKIQYSKPRNCFSLSLISEDVAPTKKPSATKKGVIIPGPFHLAPGSSVSFQITCASKSVGLHKAALRLNFRGQKIWKNVTLVAEDDISRPLAPSEAYVRPTIPTIQQQTIDQYVPGQPPFIPRSGRRLKQYPLPQLRDDELPVFWDGLSYESYKNYFFSLVHVEELQWKKDICAYDMENATMQQDKAGYLVLTVPGLLEKRPSVIYGDMIYVTPHGSNEHYQGFVHHVRAEEVLVKFHPSFHQKFIARQQHKVRFSYSRTTIRRSLRAIEIASVSLSKNFLFPQDVQGQTLGKEASAFMPINRVLNDEQRQCVSEILRKVGGPPYIIHGPPGTGKTVTVVEAILQVLKHNDDNCRVLACAPSNAAADVLLDRLRGCIQVKDMLRLNAYTRQVDDVAAEVQPYCHTDESCFCCPPLEKLVKYKVVVSTYFSVAMLEEQDLRRGHFSHIFLDEAGQAMEPEAMVAMASFKERRTVVVLAGDHLQLGPVIRSKTAIKYGLGTSLLERLSQLPLYNSSQDKSQLNNVAVTRLVRNYRSHQAILDLPSRLFYNGELIPSGPAEICGSMCGWEELPNKNFPVLFVGVEGVDQREGRSPSWFNPQEASKVTELVGKLKNWRRSRLQDNDIGIISPYSQQVKKIKTALASKNMKHIKVGSVEQFQGQEKRVIIISTVRSTKAFLETDEDPNFPFLHNPKRFNVAITRAKALLIVVGNPYVLEKHEHWKELLQYCLLHKSYKGCPPPTECREDIEEFKAFLEEDLT